VHARSFGATVMKIDGTVVGFEQEIALENADGSHDCWL
jgi:hypothetical protein